MAGKFIVFEGSDGAGKSLMLKLSKSFLEKEGFDIFVTAEPSKSIFGQKVRELLKNEKSSDGNGNVFLDLYVKDRKEHLQKEVLPALKKGKIVLCDRYKYSTIVYQSVQGVLVKKILQMHAQMAVPDLVLVLDVDPVVALKRISFSRNTLDVFEKKDFLQKVRKSFLELPALLPTENIKIIGASRDQKEVFVDVKRELQKILL